MRRALILGLPIAIMTATVMLLTASPAAPIVICPVAASGGTGGPDAITCCGPPIVRAMHSNFAPAQPCCPGPAMCAQLLSVSSSPNPSDARKKVVISGSLSGASSTPGATVTIWQRLPGENQFSKLADVTPDASGTYSLSESPDTNRQWYASANGLRSVMIEQQVQARVVLTASRTKHGGVTFRAQVTPAHPHQRVMLEVRSGRRWTVLMRPRLDKHSRATVGFLALFGSARTFRATFVGDSRNVRSSSPPLSLPRR